MIGLLNNNVINSCGIILFKPGAHIQADPGHFSRPGNRSGLVLLNIERRPGDLPNDSRPPTLALGGDARLSDGNPATP